VIRIDVRVWTTDYLVLRDPFLRNWPEQSQRCHRRFRVENIVNNAFEFESEKVKQNRYKFTNKNYANMGYENSLLLFLKMFQRKNNNAFKASLETCATIKDNF